MTTMTTSGHLPETLDRLSTFPPRCQVAYEPLSSPPSYGIELVFGGKVYQLFSNYANSPSNTVLLNGKHHLCHEPIKVFFQEFRKYVLGPRFGLVADKHQMILGLEELDDPLISEIEAENDDCTLWEFWEQTPDPTLRFQLHVPFGISVEDNEALSDDYAQPFFDEHLEENGLHMSNMDPKEIVISSPMSSSSPLTSSSPSSPHDSSFSASSSEDSAKTAIPSHYILDMNGMTVMDWDQQTVINWNKQTVMDLKKRIVYDLNSGTIFDLDKKTVLYLDQDHCALRNMTQHIGLGTTEWSLEDIQDSDEDPANDASWGSWTKRKTDDGYDADISDMSSECDGRGYPPKKARSEH